MPKLMSVLEKYSIIEKSPTTEKSAKPEKPDQIEVIVVDKQPTPNVEHSANEFANKTIGDSMNNNSLNTDLVALTIDELYTQYNLMQEPVQQTVFFLENLMQALPNELPEFVKKSTLSNILLASAVDLDSLVNDGEQRQQVLQQYIEGYENTLGAEIDDLYNQISKYNEMIAQCQNAIKSKQEVLKEQSKTIDTETQRISNIIEFCKQ
ncbi:MAG: hypothetical protein ATN35_05340 [Epulopiscium sp. Nele67-Bin004]|nr:MAG: hypothetical protein ATN35_05340 [Epulopiscium sp. Nele67-Bin004]